MRLKERFERLRVFSSTPSTTHSLPRTPRIAINNRRPAHYIFAIENHMQRTSTAFPSKTAVRNSTTPQPSAR